MVSFYPGPSRIHTQVPAYVKEAARAGVLSMNHRSEEFMALCKKTSTLLKQRLRIPKDYVILYTSSATECWEIIAHSLIETESFHFFNGAFGQKWFDYTQRLHTGAKAIPFHREQVPALLLENLDTEGVVCITQNETSNGTQIDNSLLKAFREKNPKSIITVDATSSMAGIALDFKQADVWFASVQKCFGLPAGLAVMVCSPRAIAHAQKVNNRLYYNSMPSMLAMMQKWQTTHTPNVLSIYLLMRVMMDSPSIATTHKQTVSRFKEWQQFFRSFSSLKLLVDNESVRSITVLPLEASTTDVQRIKKAAKKNGLLLGEGYGDLKTTTFRIANFPAIQQKEIASLKKFFTGLKGL
jgi:phosphoserine aminotransferase